MLIFTTLFIALLIIAVLYFLIVRFIPWAHASYAVMLTAGIAIMFIGSVHFIYIGIEVIAIGSFLVRMHYKHLGKTRRAGR